MSQFMEWTLLCTDWDLIGVRKDLMVTGDEWVGDDPSSYPCLAKFQKMGSFVTADYVYMEDAKRLIESNNSMFPWFNGKE